MKLKRTDRGFDHAAFVDRYGANCSIQKSSIATEDCIWLGIDDPPKFHLGEWLSGRMHLTRKHVKALLPLLQLFVETGELRPVKKGKKR